MKPSRRELLRGAALTGVVAGAGALAGCSQEATTGKAEDGGAEDTKITTRTIAEAEKIQGVRYTPAERAMMVEDLENNLETLAALRAIEMPDNLAPALVFDPALPGKAFGSQKNEIVLGGSYDAELLGEDADIAFASVAQLGRWLRSGALTSERLTEIYLARIERLAPKLECFITVTPEIARAQAKKADEDLAEGRDRGPLHGIPYGLKDLADTKGVLTTWGAAPFKDRVPDDDAEVVRKLERGGAVLLGKTTCGAIAYGDRWFGGRTRNPWNTEEGSSGSSAGSASATVAGLCAFSIGTETLGSIVSPSERCGATGLRPTFGRVSRAGFMALCWSLDKIGAICRSVEDTALVLSEINGYDQDDPGASRVGFSYLAGDYDVAGMTVGYVPKWFEDGDDVDRAALDAMRSLGVTLKEFPWPETSFDSLIQIVLVEAAAAFADLTLTDRDDELVWQDKEAWPNTWREARLLSAVDYVQIDRLRRRIMTELGAAFEGFDALIGPHYAGGALLATNCTGHPQLALRAGFAQTPTRGLSGDNEEKEPAETFRTPRGISLWADLFQEGNIVALGRALEAKLGVSRERPPGF